MLTEKLAKYLTIFCVGLMVTPVVSCQKEEASEHVLAEIQELKVTEDHFVSAFKRYYYKVGQSLTPSYQNKKSVLDTEFKTFVMATYAVDQGLDNDAESFLQKGIISRKVYAEEYLNREVLSVVTVSEKDLRELFLRFNTTLRASHLYAATRDEAEKLYNRLQSGETFESLANETFENAYLAANAGDLGEFTVDEMDIAFEDAAYALKQGEISKPVKTRQGYSIIKLTDRFTVPVLTEFQYASRKNNLESFVLTRKKERATRRHIEETIAALNIDEELIDEIWEDLQANQSGLLTHNFESKILALATATGLNRKLADSEEFSFTISDLKKEGFYSPAENLNRIDSAHRFESFVKGLIYRSFIISEFMQSDHTNDPAVQASIDQTFYHYLNARADEYIKSNIELSPAEIREEFLNNKEMYDFPLMVNVSRIVVESEETGKKALADIEAGLSWKEALRTYTINNKDLLVDGEMGLQPVQNYGAHAFEIKDMKEGDVIGPLTYQTGQLMIYKALDVEEPRPAQLYEVTDLVKSVLKDKKLKERRQDVIAETKRKHNAVLYEDKLQNLKIEL